MLLNASERSRVKPGTTSMFAIGAGRGYKITVPLFPVVPAHEPGPLIMRLDAGERSRFKPGTTVALASSHIQLSRRNSARYSRGGRPTCRRNARVNAL